MPSVNNKFISGFICLIAGAVITLAFAPYNYSLIGLLSPALLFYTWLKAKPVAAFIYGYSFGLGMFGTGVSWLHISINLFGGVNLFGSYLITFLLVAYLSLYPAFVGYLSKKYFAGTHALTLLVAIPALWTLSEWCRAWIFTGFPWLQLAYSQIDTPIKSLVPLIGVYGLTWVITLLSALLVLFFQLKVQQKIIIVTSVILLWVGAWFINEIDWTQKSANDIRIALIQGAVPQKLKWKPEYRQKSFDLYSDLSDPYWGSELIIWPETAIPALFHTATEFIGALHKLTKKYNTTLVVGVPVKDQVSDEYYNSAVMLDEDITMYHKRHLVPFGEYLPLKPLLSPLLGFLKIPMSNFSAGTQDTPVLSSSNLTLGISICYEDTFGEEVIRALPQANVLVNLSNDAWFGDSLAPHQHLQMARMRALETGRYMLRATNTGISAVINEHGEILNQSQQFKPESLSAEISIFKGVTPYARYGNIPVIIAAILFLIGIKSRECLYKSSRDKLKSGYG